MDKTTFNRICDLSDIILEDDTSKIKDILVNKIFITESLADKILELSNNKKTLALWIAKTFKEKTIKNASKFTQEELETEDIFTYSASISAKYFGIKEGNPDKYIKLKIYDINEPDFIPLKDTQVEDVSSYIMDDLFENMYQETYTSIIDWYRYYQQPGRTNINLNDYNYEEAFEESDRWHEKLKSGTLEKSSEALEKEKKDAIITFDDGWYWLDLNTTYSGEECSMMGHCGRTSANTLISLRDDKGQAHLTMAYDYAIKPGEGYLEPRRKQLEGGKYYQLKGTKNSKPKEEYHDKIVDLFIKLKIKAYEPEYKSENDFNVIDLSKDLLNKLKSNGINTSGLIPRKVLNDYISNKILHPMPDNKYIIDNWKVTHNDMLSFELHNLKYEGYWAKIGFDDFLEESYRGLSKDFIETWFPRVDLINNKIKLKEKILLDPTLFTFNIEKDIKIILDTLKPTIEEWNKAIEEYKKLQTSNQEKVLEPA